MIKRAILVQSALLALFGQSAFAITPLAFWIEPDGETFLWNTGEEPFDFWGYVLESPTGGLDPDGWHSISQSFVENPSAVFAAFGPNAANWRELISDANWLGEENVDLTIQPGVRFSIGRPFRSIPLAETDRPSYVPVLLATSFRMDVVYAPEPSGFLLATLAGLGLVALRSRNLRSGACRPV